MGKVKKLFRYFHDSDYRFRVNASHGAYKNMPDKLYLKRMYKAKKGTELHLDNPQTLDEKLQWLKLNDRKLEYPQLVDKYEAKTFVAKVIGNEYVVPLLGVWDDPEEIEFDALPEQFVLKCTHDSQGLVICKNKRELNVAAAKKKLRKCLKRDYYSVYREWPYKMVKPRIIAEEYLEDETGFLTDYKFYCFNGVPDCVLTCFDRQMGDTKYYFFDRNWELKRYNKRGLEAPAGFTKPKPDGINKMFDLAETLAKASKAPFIRVDFYNVYGKIYFGELTLYPAAGFDLGRLPETDVLFGKMLSLPSI